MNTQSRTVAETILAQLGGRRFIAMTGAKSFIDPGNGGLMFALPSGTTKNKANRVQVFLTPRDTYRVAFTAYRAGNSKPVSEFDDVYCTDLANLFTAETGLYTTLGVSK